ncbi:hypothetical protein niasHT_014235 [Heterodera trifolii]|uniref:Uncharacterized protein n=1 Tax=Heterodera trifolii TaxID=157864 RepID=A0ABD2KXD4_9BILA
MYRQLLQLNHLQIYCIRGDWCDYDCGKFHRRKLNISDNNVVRAHVDKLEKAALQNNENEQNTAPNLTLPSESPLQDANNPTANDAFSLPLPSSPFPTSHTPSPTGSLASRQNGKLSVSVTLDDIIASARRKISEDYKEIQLPSPVFLDDQDQTLWDKRAAKKRLLFHHSSLDVPAMESIDTAHDDFAHRYEDMDSEAELAIQEEPPRYINDEEAEDFEEMIKAARPPLDAFSNPILLRDADPLTTRKKMTKRGSGKRSAASGGGGGSTLLRQHSKSRLKNLSEQSDSRTPSVTCTNDDYDDGADNSSIVDTTEMLAELSAMVAKSTAHSGATSPANILQFIEEQKQKASSQAVAGGQP